MLPLLLAGLGLVGANIINGISQSHAIKNATRAQEDAANKARGFLQPYSDIGLQNMRSLNQGVNSGAYTPNMSGWETDPGYQFRQQQGLNAINAGGAAGGMRFSGATMKALARYNQNFASNEYSNVYNRKQSELNNQYTRQAGLANMGVGAASGMAGNAYDMGNVQSQGIMSQQNARNNTMNNINSLAMTGLGAYMGGMGNQGGNGFNQQYQGAQIPQTAQGAFEQRYGQPLSQMGIY